MESKVGSDPLRGTKRNKVKISLVGLYFLTRKLIEGLSPDQALLQDGVFPIRP